jgi:hypothetical protein
MPAKHNIELLTLQDGQVYDVRCMPPQHGPYFRAQPLEIVNKGAVQPQPDGRFKFEFVLSANADAVWIHLFEEEQKMVRLPGLHVSFDGSRMYILGTGETIATLYSHAKSLVKKANTAYELERESVTSQVRARAEEVRRKALTAEDRMREASAALNKLQL